MREPKINALTAWLAAIFIAALLAFPLNRFLAPTSFESAARELNLFHQVRERINGEYYRKDIKSKESRGADVTFEKGLLKSWSKYEGYEYAAEALQELNK